MFRPMCKCVGLGCLGAILFIAMATVFENPISQWGVPTWTAFVILLGSFVVCGLIQRRTTKRELST